MRHQVSLATSSKLGDADKPHVATETSEPSRHATPDDEDSKLSPSERMSAWLEENNRCISAMVLLFLVVALILLCVAIGLLASHASDFHRVYHQSVSLHSLELEYWETKVAQNPILLTYTGNRTRNAQLPDPSLVCHGRQQTADSRLSILT